MSAQNGIYVVSTLIARKLAGEITDSERLDLERWMNESAEHKQLHDVIVDPVNKAERDNYIKEIDADAGWQEVSGRLFGEKRKRVLFTGYRVAASIALVCAAIAVFYLYRSQRATPDAFEVQAARITAGTSQAVVKLHNGEAIALADRANLDRQFEEANGTNLYNTAGSLSYHAGQANGHELIYNEIFVPRAGEYRLTLADGTRVWLNSETQLKYPVQFAADERVVTLTGEAYFEVAPETNRPFMVNTPHQGCVQVYGTRFNINAYAGSQYCLVTLNEGKVSVRKEGGGEQMLRPDQQAVLHERGDDIRIANVDASQFSAWKDGMLVFDNLSFYDISELLSRWYDVQFEFGEDSIKAYRFTADIKRYGSFRDVLRFFEKTNKLAFEIEGRTIRVVHR